MFSLSHFQHFSAFSAVLLLLGGGAFGEDITSLADPKNILDVRPIELSQTFKFKIPARPAGHVLDTAHFLTADLEKSLEEALSKGARDHGVYVYVLTVPAVQKNSLEPFTQQVANDWTKDLFGGVVVFDDETGRVAIQQSAVVANRFYEFELAALLKETMKAQKRPKLSRAGLEHTVLSLKNALEALKMRADREDGDPFFMRLGLAIVGVVAVLLGAVEYVRRRASAEEVGVKVSHPPSSQA